MKRLYFLIPVLFLSLSFSSIAQKKYASNVYVRLGGSLFFPWESQGNALFFPALTIGPGFRIIQGTDFALIASLPISAGAVFNTYNESYFGFDAPAMLEMHFGSATGNSKDKSAGFVLGAGAGYHFTGDYRYPYYYDYENPDYYEYRQLDFWGYRLLAGVSFGKDRTGSGDRGMIAVQYGRSLASDKKYTIGVGLYGIIGNTKKSEEPPAY